MAFVVETGAGLAAANSYASENDLDAWCESTGQTMPTDAEARLVRATAWLDGKYRARYPGTREHQREQGLEWPRLNAVDREGYLIPAGDVPAEIVNATCAAAMIIDTLYSSSAGGAFVIRERLGPMETEYGTAEPGSRDVREITDILAPIIGSASSFVGRAVRA